VWLLCSAGGILFAVSNDTFSADDFQRLCDELASKDPDLSFVVQTYGYPPLWSRSNSYETLVQIILEQQVSLASARAALEKLRTRVKDITPENVALLTDEEFRAAYFSRQKTSYVKDLTERILSKQLDIGALAALSNDEIRQRLLQVKGIGHWTIDVYLILVLHRADFFPLGDLAAVNALRLLKNLPKGAPHEKLLDMTMQWQPYRSVGTMLLWHYYLSSRR
jgi:DNA-3-methyladenine glycosylase II